MGVWRGLCQGAEWQPVAAYYGLMGVLFCRQVAAWSRAAGTAGTPAPAAGACGDALLCAAPRAPAT